MQLILGDLQEKKTQKEHERDKRIAEGEAEAAVDNPRLKEREKLMSLLSPLGLVIRDITPDGHCLYAALSDQLSLRLGVKVNLHLTLSSFCGTHYCYVYNTCVLNSTPEQCIGAEGTVCRLHPFPF